MDAFEKWIKGYYIEHGFISSEAEMREAFRAGLRMAGGMCKDRSAALEPGRATHEEGGCYMCGAEEEADYLANAILAEADK